MPNQQTAPIPIDLARDQLLASIDAIEGTETVDLDQACGRIAAETITSTIDLPRTYNAAVDGYGVGSASLIAAPDRPFKIVGVARAGHPFDGVIGAGEAIEIYTGGVMPQGPDCVAMHEDCTRSGDEVVIAAKLARGSNMRPPGENLAKGEIVIAKGQVVSAALVGQLAASGTAQISVRRRLRVAVLSTGDEVVPAGSPASHGQIFDANRPMLKAILASSQITLIDCGIVPDRLAALSAAYENALAAADVVISSGGASDGIEDHTQQAMQQVGANCAFWRLAMKPGRPMAVGRREKQLIFCLPGNPVAAFVCTRLLIKPVLIKLSDGAATPILKIRVPAGFTHRKKPGRAEFLRVVLVDDTDGQHLQLHGRKGAGVISSLTGADGLVEIPLENAGVDKGLMLNFLPFHERGL
ncbi:MAG: molybdopterin molybdotransferase MoeA [Candidatus Puniceispirillum sp.]|nr:molybdopterin molybdotransferase MoeA [Candidatus Puniceispirillum sp.]